MRTVRLMELVQSANADPIMREIRSFSAPSIHVHRILVELMQTVQLTELVQFVDVDLDILGTHLCLAVRSHALNLHVE